MLSLKSLMEIKQTSTAGKTKEVVPPAAQESHCKVGICFVCLDMRGAVSLWILPGGDKQGIAEAKKALVGGPQHLLKSFWWVLRVGEAEEGKRSI